MQTMLCLHVLLFWIGRSRKHTGVAVRASMGDGFQLDAQAKQLSRDVSETSCSLSSEAPMLQAKHNPFLVVLTCASSDLLESQLDCNV